MSDENDTEKSENQKTVPLYEPSVAPLPPPNERAMGAMGGRDSRDDGDSNVAPDSERASNVLRRDGDRWVDETGQELLDSKGRAFDPSIHAVDDGRPRLTKKGTLATKRGRKKKADQPVSILPERDDTARFQPKPVEGSTPSEPGTRERARATASVLVSTAESLAKMMIGKEAAFQGEEKAAMIEAWSSHFETLGDVDLPPWAPPLIVTASWGARVMSEPEVRARREAERAERQKDAKEKDDTTKHVVLDPETAQANAHFSETGFL